MATLTERVVVDRTSPARSYDGTIDLELLEDGTAISAALTRAVVELTETTSGAVTTLDSDTEGWGSGQPFDWDSGTGVLSMRLGPLVPAAGAYRAELDVYDGTRWYRWTLTDDLVIVAE